MAKVDNAIMEAARVHGEATRAEQGGKAFVGPQINGDGGHAIGGGVPVLVIPAWS